jgi:hypothetical protein
MVGRRIETIRDAGHGDGLRIIVGGPPINAEFSALVGRLGARRQLGRPRHVGSVAG